MANENLITKARQRISSFFVPDKERIELLKSILEQEQNRKISYEEAEEVGRELISFYECLASDPDAIEQARKAYDG